PVDFTKTRLDNANAGDVTRRRARAMRRMIVSLFRGVGTARCSIVPVAFDRVCKAAAGTHRLHDAVDKLLNSGRVPGDQTASDSKDRLRAVGEAQTGADAHPV